MNSDQRGCMRQQERWRHIELTFYRILLGLMALVSTLYLQKLEVLLLGSQWLATSASLSSSILLFACWYRKRIIEAASYYHGKIRGIEFWVHQDALTALCPLWGDFLLSEDVSREDILDVLTSVSARLETVWQPFRRVLFFLNLIIYFRFFNKNAHVPQNFLHIHLIFMRRHVALLSMDFQCNFVEFVA